MDTSYNREHEGIISVQKNESATYLSSAQNTTVRGISGVSSDRRSKRGATGMTGSAERNDPLPHLNFFVSYDQANPREICQWETAELPVKNNIGWPCTLPDGSSLRVEDPSRLSMTPAVSFPLGVPSLQTRHFMVCRRRESLRESPSRRGASRFTAFSPPEAIDENRPAGSDQVQSHHVL